MTTTASLRNDQPVVPRPMMTLGIALHTGANDNDRSERSDSCQLDATWHETVAS